MQWAGRTNDMRPEKLMGLEDVYTGGRQQRDIDARVEAALTRRDEFGRVLTPKESFRQLCYKCVPPLSVMGTGWVLLFSLFPGHAWCIVTSRYMLGARLFLVTCSLSGSSKSIACS